MMSDAKRDFYMSALQAGVLTPPQQIALAEELLPLFIEARKALWFRDEMTREAQEQDELDRQAAKAASYRPVAEVLQFPRRAVPVRLVDPPIQPADGIYR